jgi:hypothetical protein
VVWAFLGFLIFMFLIIFKGLRNYRKIPVEFGNLANSLGITLVRTWATPGEGGASSPFQYGPCYAGTYRDLAVAVSTVVGNEGGMMGTGLVFRFIRPLSVSLFCALDIDPFTAMTIRDEYRDIYLKRIDTGIMGLKAWAGDRGKAMMLLRGGDVYAHLERLAGLVAGINGFDDAALPDLRRAGFMVNDQGITLLVAEPAMLNREIVEEAFLLAQVLSSSGFGMPGGLVRVESHGFKVLAMILLVLFMGFIIGVMITGIWKLKLTPVLSVWGLD